MHGILYFILFGSILLFIYFEPGTHVAQAGLNLLMWQRPALNPCTSCLYLLSERIIGICYHARFGYDFMHWREPRQAKVDHWL